MMSLSQCASVGPDMYAQFAGFYDRYTEHPLYDTWINGLMELAREHGYADGPVLDMGCGSGKSLTPLLAAGLPATGSEPVREMRALAEQRTAGSCELLPYAAAELPVIGSFELILLLNDVVNYMLDGEELTEAFCCLAANLASGGLLLFDANTLLTFRSLFAQDVVTDDGDVFFVWRGLSKPALESGGIAEAQLETFAEQADGCWRRVACRNVQRHHPDSTVRQALDDAGLDVVVVLGQDGDGSRHPGPPVELADRKRIYLARKP